MTTPYDRMLEELSKENRRLRAALILIRKFVANGNMPVLVRLGMIEQTVMQALPQNERWEMPNPQEPSETPERGADWKIKREP